MLQCGKLTLVQYFNCINLLGKKNIKYLTVNEVNFLPCCRSVTKDITPAGGSQKCSARFNVFDGQFTREVVHILICTSYTGTHASDVELMVAQDVLQVERLFERAVLCVEALADRQVRRTD